MLVWSAASAKVVRAPVDGIHPSSHMHRPCNVFSAAGHSLSPQQRRPLGLQAQPPATACTEPANNKLWSYCKGKGLEPLLCINGAELPVSICYLGGRYEKYRVDSGTPFVSHAIQNTPTHAAGSGRQGWHGVVLF